jgi:hypothetical protein
MGVVGSRVEVVRSRLGVPAAERRVGKERWLVYESPDVTLRIRCEGASEAERDRDVEHVASWMAALRLGYDTLREATEPFGLWPACAPDEAAPAGSSLLCRSLEDPATGAVHTLTATVREGRVVQITVFDEPPEWRHAGGI